ncbi:uncharacterized protein LOC126372986 [Pectinophora gossypiella]|uniref:uncharacterized protein LOC126372986 n=1 Tax=Pectinophora gossypiella TaxID=13191 RepID=UPI00214EC82A|nr:uncharacterized protein LOC126372986 [Pectinophora gossypiella]
MWGVFIISMICGYVQALSDAELKAEFTKIVMGCMKDHPVPISELMGLQALIPPTKKEVKCLLACAYKKEGTMTASGLYDLDHAYKVAELAKEGDEKRLKNGKKIADICVKVNEIEVSDGEKGCERAGLIFKCVAENAPKYGFKV